MFGQAHTGYTIPAGWAIMLVNSASQVNPNTFKDRLQEFWSFATNVLVTTKKSLLLGIH